MTSATVQITDSHCHLDFPDFDAERDAVIARAIEAGVTRMVAICTKLSGLAKVQAISEAHAEVFHTFGVHPMSAHEHPPVTAEQLVSLSAHPKFVGIGETGLDYHYTAESAEIQKASLRVHCAAAAEAGLPLIIHARAADADMAAILSEEHANAPFDCVMHCFSSGAGLAKAALDLGFYLSMSGIAAFPKSQELRDILAPPPYRGKRNEPGYTVHTAKVGAEVFGLSYEAFAAATQENFDRLFAKAARWQKAQAA